MFLTPAQRGVFPYQIAGSVPPHQSSIETGATMRIQSTSRHHSFAHTAEMSLGEWAASEERRCAKSKAREAVRRIREAQDGSTVLFLHCLNLRTVPPLEGCQHVTMYDLTGNRLSQIPADLGDLPNLKYLALHNNGLSDIPALKQYERLEMLGITCNPIRHIPASLRARSIQIVDIDTFVDRQSRNRYRQHVFRQKTRDLIRKIWPGAPEAFLPWVDRQVLLLSPKYGPRIRGQAD